MLFAVRKPFRVRTVERSDEAIPAGAAAALLDGEGFTLVHSSFRQLVKPTGFADRRLHSVNQLRINSIDIAHASEIAARRVYRGASRFDCTPITFDTWTHPKRSGRSDQTA